MSEESERVGSGTEGYGAGVDPTAVALALAGADDIRFAAFALRVARTAPSCVATLVPGGGHAAHLAQPELTGRVVGHWLGLGEDGRA